MQIQQKTGTHFYIIDQPQINQIFLFSENIVVEKRKKKPKEETSRPSYIDLFDRGKWEELDHFLRKNPFDENVSRLLILTYGPTIKNC